jgi:predicted N-acyltransferase
MNGMWIKNHSFGGRVSDFAPITAHSIHWRHHPQSARTSANYLKREQHGVEYYMDELHAHAPFKADVPEQWRVQ